MDTVTNMSNIKHPKCAIRSLASAAKSRLSKGEYTTPAAPRNITPQQRDIYVKLCELQKRGEEVVNPIAQFADEKKMRSLSHDERQRYIIQLAADYVSMRNMLEANVKSNVCS